MHVFACPCLNIQVHARGATPLLRDVTYPHFAKMISTDPFFSPNAFAVTLDLGGVTKSQKSLCKERLVDDWTVTTCSCCGFEMYAHYAKDHNRVLVNSSAEESDRSNRFDYLLQQTEIFSHFMTSGANPKGGSPVKLKPGRPKLKKIDEKAKLSAVGDHRHRMTEQEEDEELLSESRKGSKVFAQFDASPSCAEKTWTSNYASRRIFKVSPGDIDKLESLLYEAAKKCRGIYDSSQGFIISDDDLDKILSFLYDSQTLYEYKCGSARPLIASIYEKEAERYGSSFNKDASQFGRNKKYIQPKFKTKLCQYYESSRTCSYGRTCLFAHGIDELRKPKYHQNYKTRFCRDFHSTGFCSYGTMCSFLH